MLDNIIEEILNLHFSGDYDAVTLEVLLKRYGVESTRFFEGIVKILRCRDGEESEGLDNVLNGLPDVQKMEKGDDSTLEGFIQDLLSDAESFARLTERLNNALDSQSLYEMFLVGCDELRTKVFLHKYYHRVIIKSIDDIERIKKEGASEWRRRREILPLLRSVVRYTTEIAKKHELSQACRSLHESMFDLMKISTSRYAKKNAGRYFVEEHQLIYENVTGERSVLKSFPSHSSHLFVELGDEYAVCQDPTLAGHSTGRFLVYRKGKTVIQYIDRMQLHYRGYGFFYKSGLNRDAICHVSSEGNVTTDNYPTLRSLNDVKVFPGPFLFINNKLERHRWSNEFRDSEVKKERRMMMVEIMAKLEHPQTDDFGELSTCFRSEIRGKDQFFIYKEPYASLQTSEFYSQRYRDFITCLTNLNMNIDCEFSKIPQDVLFSKIIPFIRQIDVVMGPNFRQVKLVLKMKNLSDKNEFGKKLKKKKRSMDRYYRIFQVSSEDDVIKMVYYLRNIRINGDPSDTLEKMLSCHDTEGVSGRIRIKKQYKNMIVRILDTEFGSEYIRKKCVKEVVRFISHLQTLETEFSVNPFELCLEDEDLNLRIRNIVDEFCRSKNSVSDLLFRMVVYGGNQKRNSDLKCFLYGNEPRRQSKDENLSFLRTSFHLFFTYLKHQRRHATNTDMRLFWRFVPEKCVHLFCQEMERNEEYFQVGEGQRYDTEEILESFMTILISCREPVFSHHGILKILISLLDERTEDTKFQAKIADYICQHFRHFFREITDSEVQRRSDILFDDHVMKMKKYDIFGDRPRLFKLIVNFSSSESFSRMCREDRASLRDFFERLKKPEESMVLGMTREGAGEADVCLLNFFDRCCRNDEWKCFLDIFGNVDKILDVFRSYMEFERYMCSLQPSCGEEWTEKKKEYHNIENVKMLMSILLDHLISQVQESLDRIRIFLEQYFEEVKDVIEPSSLDALRSAIINELESKRRYSDFGGGSCHAKVLGMTRSLPSPNYPRFLLGLARVGFLPDEDGSWLVLLETSECLWKKSWVETELEESFDFLSSDQRDFLFQELVSVYMESIESNSRSSELLSVIKTIVLNYQSILHCVCDDLAIKLIEHFGLGMKASKYQDTSHIELFLRGLRTEPIQSYANSVSGHLIPNIFANQSQCWNLRNMKKSVLLVEKRCPGFLENVFTNANWSEIGEKGKSPNVTQKRFDQLMEGLLSIFAEHEKLNEKEKGKQQLEKKSDKKREEEMTETMWQFLNRNVEIITLWRDHLIPFFRAVGQEGLTKEGLAKSVFKYSYHGIVETYQNANVPARINEVFAYFSDNIHDCGNGKFSWFDRDVFAADVASLGGPTTTDDLVFDFGGTDGDVEVSTTRATKETGEQWDPKKETQGGLDWNSILEKKSTTSTLFFKTDLQEKEGEEQEQEEGSEKQKESEEGKQSGVDWLKEFSF